MKHHKRSRFFLYTPIEKMGAAIITVHKGETILLSNLTDFKKNSLLDKAFCLVEKFTSCKKFSFKQKKQIQRQIKSYWENDINDFRTKVESLFHEKSTKILVFEVDDEELQFHYLIERMKKNVNIIPPNVDILKIEVLKNPININLLTNQPPITDQLLSNIENNNFTDYRKEIESENSLIEGRVDNNETLVVNMCTVPIDNDEIQISNLSKDKNSSSEIDSCSNNDVDNESDMDVFQSPKKLTKKKL